MSNDNDGFDGLMEQFHLEFIETTLERLSAVDDLITVMIEDKGSETALLEFLRHIHSIKGLGGTFDFPTLTNVAHRLEDYIETAPEHTDKQLKDIQYFVDVIRQILENGVDPDDDEKAKIFAALPITAKDFDDVEAFDDSKPIQEMEILLVMPKGTQRKIIGKELAACGFLISNADTPVAAIKYAVDHKPDIVIASRIMEQMGGLELARVLAEIKSTKSCHIVIATAAGKHDSQLTDIPEAVRVVRKGPGFIDDLTACLDDWGLFG